MVGRNSSIHEDEELAEDVRKYPCLFDKADNGYKERETELKCVESSGTLSSLWQRFVVFLILGMRFLNALSFMTLLTHNHIRNKQIHGHHNAYNAY